MYFVINYEFTPEVRDEAQARFKAGGGLPPAGVTMHARWHHVGGLAGFVIAESDDPVAIGTWMQEWNDLLDFSVTPIVDDAQVQTNIGD